MKFKKLLIIPMALILSSCTNTFSKNQKGLLDEENINIISSINELAIDTFIPKVKETEAKSGWSDQIKEDPKHKSDVKEDLIKNVEKFAEEDPKAKWVYDNFYNITNVEAYLTGNDKDTIEFVYNMNNGITDFPNTPGESLDLGRKTPYYTQWDNRWAYNPLGYRNIGISGCGPTSIAMILSRLQNDKSITPDKIAEDAQGYMAEDGISWNFFYDGASKYGYDIADINLVEEDMVNALKDGPLLVSVNRGYFTLFGHIFVIDSYEDGKFIINDPNSIKNSKRPWSFDEISGQIAHIWSIKNN